MHNAPVCGMKISEQRLTNEAVEPFVHNRLGRRAARWRHMADYVSSYPTLWPVSDMLAPPLQGKAASGGRESGEEDSEKPDPHHTSVTFSLISAPLRDLSCPEKVNILL